MLDLVSLVSAELAALTILAVLVDVSARMHPSIVSALLSGSLAFAQGGQSAAPVSFRCIRLRYCDQLTI